MQVSHFRILTRRFRETFAFYRDVIGLSTTYPETPTGPYAEFDLGGDRYLGLFDRALMAEAAGVEDEPAGVPDDRMVICIQVDDCDAEAERLGALGVAIVRPGADHVPWGMRTSYVRDPEGNLIEFYSGLKHDAEVV